jgi:hypothetical protein
MLRKEKGTVGQKPAEEADRGAEPASERWMRDEQSRRRKAQSDCVDDAESTGNLTTKTPLLQIKLIVRVIFKRFECIVHEKFGQK